MSLVLCDQQRRSVVLQPFHWFLSKVFTYFRREKVTPVLSRKKFKQTKKKQKMRRSICDSSSSMSNLSSPSNVGRRGKVGRKRKAGKISVVENSDLLSGVLKNTEDVKDNVAGEVKADPPLKRAKICPHDNEFAVKDIGDMIRNAHNVVVEGIINSPPVSQAVIGEKTDDLNRGGRGGSVRGQTKIALKTPVFTIEVPNTQLCSTAGSSQSRVVRFSGSKGGKDREGPTMFVGQKQDRGEGELRPIVIDGSNVAMSHGLDNIFSSRGIELVVKYFTARGHKKVVAFVPQFRNKHNMSTDRELLEQLYKARNLVYTPSREVDGTRISSYDDAFILDYAAMHGGVVITRDNYRDLAHDKQEWLEVVRNRILMPTFIGDDVMFPSDPLGRNGPNLDKFLRF